jgi:HEAT repeat protein
MPTAEEAGARLDALRDPAWRSRADQRVAALPRGLRSIAGPFILPEGVWIGSLEHVVRQQAAAQKLDGLAAADRERVMAALHPGLGPALARWWTDAQQRPYQRAWDRKAFRAAHCPGLTVDGRADDLAHLVTAAGPFPADPAWLAIWGGYLAGRERYWYRSSQVIGGLLASAIDLGGPGGQEVLTTLTEIGRGEHPAGVMGRHVIIALLGSARPEGWEFMERLLLAAQRQEGLRQSILEAADEGHPAAFDRMLAVVLDNKMLRFAAAIRAAGVWLGFTASIDETPRTEARLRALAAFRASEPRRQAALAGQDPWEAFIALAAGGMTDVMATIPQARDLAGSPSPDLRAAAIRYASATSLDDALPLLTAALDDPDVRVAALAATLLAAADGAAEMVPAAFDALARLIPRLPVQPAGGYRLGVEEAPVTIGKAHAAGIMVRFLGGRPVAELLPWLSLMDSAGRGMVASLIAGDAWWDRRAGRAHPMTADLRPVMISLLSDRSSRVRDTALRALTKAKLAPAEAPAVEALLTRSATDTRRGALTLLASLPAAAARESAARLAASKDKRQRDASAELLRAIGGSGDESAKGRRGPARAAASAAATPSGAADSPPEAGRGPGADRPIEDLHVTLAGNRVPPAPPRSGRTPARPGDRAAGALVALDGLAHGNRDVPVTVSGWQGNQEMLLGDVKVFPSPFGSAWLAADDPVRDTGPLVAPMVLGEVFRAWWASRPAALRGEDEGLDALRAYILAQPHPVGTSLESPVMRALTAFVGSDWWRKARRQLAGDPPKGLEHPDLVRHVTTGLVAEHANGKVIDECLDALEATLARVPREVVTAAPDDSPRPGYHFGHVGGLQHGDWRHFLGGHPWHELLVGLLHVRPALFSTAQVERWYRLMRWLEQPHPNAQPLPVRDELLATAHQAGAASDDDVVAAFLRPGNWLFRSLTRHWRTQQEARYPGLIPIADRVRDEVVAVELRRGDLPTPTSRTASNISSVHGVTIVAQLLARLGAAQLTRGWTHGSDSKDAVLSHLVRVSFPAPGEGSQDLKAAAAAAGIPDARLIDLALYAPQWAMAVQEALGWPGLAEGVLWLYAHTKDQQWSAEQELRDSWAAMTAERTALSAEDLIDGAVDVEWFRRAYDTLGATRWPVVYKAARHASGGNGHRRAQVFAEAMLGQADEGALIARIRDKRNQDAVRALGLLPVPADRAARAEVVRHRYAVLREFERGSRQFGAQRQASEKAAVRIGIENLARSAGYPDPQRFTWAVEALEAGDLADGPVCVTAGAVTLTLAVDAEGTPGLAVSRAGRSLKSVPAALRKDPGIAALTSRKTALARQATRVRQSLEAAMVAQDAFSAADFAELRRHPVVAPMLAQLVWVTQDGRTRLLGDGPGPAAAPEPDGPLRIAHPVDLIADGSWVSWQERLFAAGRRQPFKQVFRELYALTGQERAESPISRRYEGHQLQPRQALALFTGRGWVTSWESGAAARPFHRHGLTARVTFANGILTPAEADLPAIDGVYFTRRGEYLAQPLDSVPAVVFSEAMRDLDLVVSVAHAGGVDPEATASTTAMRAALIRETARLLKLANIEFAGDNHVIITGRLGEYSLHLGSGTVHRRPGGAVCIIPVGSQHRGRLFLPFADDDPKTAEIVSKALLLARDHEIKDPTILEQLRS